MTPSSRNTLLPHGDHERSTVYQVREAARQDLNQHQHRRTNLRRPRSYSREEQDTRLHYNKKNQHHQDEFDMSQLPVESLDGNILATHGRVTGIDYTSRPVTPAHSEWSSRSLHSSGTERHPESLDEGHGDRPSTAMAFHADSTPSSSVQQQQQGNRYGSGAQRQRKRNQQRRDKKRRQDERQKSKGMHDQPATSWSWAGAEDEGKQGDRGPDGDDGGNDEDDEDGRQPPQWTPVVRDMLANLTGMSAMTNPLQQRLDHIRTIEKKINELMTVMYEYRESSIPPSHSSTSSTTPSSKISRRMRGRQHNLDQGIGIIMDVHKKMMRGIHTVMNDASAHVRIQLGSGRLLFRLVAMCTTMSTWKSTAASSGSQERARQRHMKQILTVVRMLFLLSKTKTNDRYFRSETMLHSLLELLSGEDRGGGGSGGSGSGGGRTVRVRLPISILVYATGTLKNCCMSDADNQKVVGHQGGIQTLTDMANAVIKSGASGRASKDGKTSDKQIVQLLVQITGILCAMCKRKQHQPQFWSNHTVPMLCSALKRFVPVDVTQTPPTHHNSPDVELHLNCVRILSKLSLHSKGRDAMAGTGGGGGGGGGSPGSTSRTLECLVRLCTYSHWLKHDAMLVRTLFVLGNVTAGGGESSNANRLDIANSNVNMPRQQQQQSGRRTRSESKTQDHSVATEGEVQRIDGMRMMCTVVSKRALALETLMLSPKTATTATASTRETEEVLVKAVRTLANLSLEPSLGTRLSRDSTFVVGLLSVLRATTSVPMPLKATPARNTREELMMNVVSSLSNISFYGGHSILQHGKEISRILVRLLTMGVSGERNEEGEGGQKEGKTNGDEEEEDDFHSWLSLECARVYGNFSRSAELRACMRATGADVAMVMLMAHNDRELVHSSCGVLVNLAITPEGKRLLLQARGNGLLTILSVIKDAGTKDIALSTLACRALYNVYMTESNSVGGEGESKEGRESQRESQRECVATRNRLRASVRATLDELEDVVTDMVEDFEDDGLDKDDEEWQQCRDFLSVVRPMLASFEKMVDVEVGEGGREMLNNVGTETQQNGRGEEDEHDLVPLEHPKDRRK